MIENSYTYSQLSSESVARLVASHYGLDKELSCEFYVLGLHDNYLIKSDGEKFFLRVYRNNWRSEQEVSFELELLAYLNKKTDLVAELVLTASGNLKFQINSPEGSRVAALFRYAKGQAPEKAITSAEAARLGCSVASVHILSDSFAPTSTRQELDISYLLDSSINAVTPYLDINQMSFLSKLRDKLVSTIPKLEKEPGVYGICHGDVNPSNFHIDESNKITLFDFDQCGYGYRAFEVGKFYSSVRHHKDKQQIKNAFLEGYQSIRLLSAIELEAIPIFEIISVIWVMAIQVYNADRIGFKYLGHAYWERRFADLEKLASD